MNISKKKSEGCIKNVVKGNIYYWKTLLKIDFYKKDCET